MLALRRLQHPLWAPKIGRPDSWAPINAKDSPISDGEKGGELTVGLRHGGSSSVCSYLRCMLMHVRIFSSRLRRGE